MHDNDAAKALDDRIVFWHWFVPLIACMATGVLASFLVATIAHQPSGGGTGCLGGYAHGWPLNERNTVLGGPVITSINGGPGMPAVVNSQLSLINLILNRVFGAAIGLMIGSAVMLGWSMKPTAHARMRDVMLMLFAAGALIGIAIIVVHPASPFTSASSC